MAMQAFKPQTLRAILLVALIIVISGGLGLFYLGLNQVRMYALEVNHSIADAEASNIQVQRLQSLKGEIAQSELLISRANQMFATPSTYQNQAITDTRNYAAAANLNIAKVSFEPYTAGVNPTMTLSFKSPVSYSKLIQFLNGIEGNIPKMQVSSIGISHQNGGGSDSVTVDDIKLTIATR